MNIEFPHGLFAMRCCKMEYNLLKKVNGQANSQLVDHQVDPAALGEHQTPLRDFIIVFSLGSMYKDGGAFIYTILPRYCSYGTY